MAYEHELLDKLTMSNVFSARSLTNGRAMMGIFWLARSCWVWFPRSICSFASILYGTDIAADGEVGGWGGGGGMVDFKSIL